MDVSTGLPAGNPFEAALAGVTQLFPPTPPDYKYRIGAQLALCALLMVVSLAYVVLLLTHGHKTGVPPWLFKLQKNPRTRWNRRIMINSMPVFAILAFMGAGGQLGSRYYNWMTFIEHRAPLGYTAAQFTPWVPIFVQAWFFSFSNLQATMGARGKLGSSFRGSCHPVIHNFILIGLPLTYVVMILPVALVTSARQDTLFRNTWALEPILRKASESYAAGQAPDMTVMYQLSQVQTELAAQSSVFKKYIVLLCSLCLTWSAIIGIMNAFNLLLVFTLKSSVKFINEHGGSGSHSTGAIVWEKASEAPIEPGCTGCTRKLRKSSRLFGGRSVQDTRTSQTESRETFALSTQDLAMKRLAADLTIAIPCVLAMVIIMVVGLGVLIQKQFERLTWTIQEFTIDGFCYIYMIITITAMCFLIKNLIQAWRIQQVVTPLNTASITGEQHTSFPWGTIGTRAEA